VTAEIHRAGDLPRRPRIFYGWWIVIAAGAASLFNSVSTFAGFGAFFLPIQREFHTDRASLSAAVSLARLEGSLLGPLEGWLVDRYGPRILMRIGMIIMGLGFILVSMTQNITMFYLAFVLGIALGASLGAGTPGSVAVANWFVKKRSTAFGLVNAGFAIGTILVPAVGWLVESLGWRQAALILGIIIWVTGIPLSFIMRHKPEQYGYLPDGVEPAPVPTAAAPGEGVGASPAARQEAATPIPVEEVNFTTKQALVTRAFWMLGLSFAFRTLATGAVNVHQIPFMLDQGYSLTEATLSVSAVGVGSFIGRVVLGWMGDRTDKRYALAASLAAMAVGMFIFATSTTMSQVLVFAAIYGLGFGGTAPLMSALRGEYFGRQHFGAIGGFQSLLVLIGTAGGPTFAGIAYDRTGDYRWAFTVISLVAFIGVGLTLAATPPKEVRALAEKRTV